MRATANMHEQQQKSSTCFAVQDAKHRQQSHRQLSLNHPSADACAMHHNIMRMLQHLHQQVPGSVWLMTNDS